MAYIPPNNPALSGMGGQNSGYNPYLDPNQNYNPFISPEQRALEMEQAGAEQPGPSKIRKPFDFNAGLDLGESDAPRRAAGLSRGGTTPSSSLPPSLAAMLPSDGGGGPVSGAVGGGAVLDVAPPSAPPPEMGGGGGPQPGAAPEILAGPTELRQGIGNRIPPSLAALLKPKVY